jgi:hypothetical protein
LANSINAISVSDFDAAPISADVRRGRHLLKQRSGAGAIPVACGEAPTLMADFPGTRSGYRACMFCFRGEDAAKRRT